MKILEVTVYVWLEVTENLTYKDLKQILPTDSAITGKAAEYSMGDSKRWAMWT